VRVGENDQAIDTLRELMAVPSGGVRISPALLKLDPAGIRCARIRRFRS